MGNAVPVNIALFPLAWGCPDFSIYIRRWMSGTTWVGEVTPKDLGV